jgi:nitroreductase
MYLKEAICTRRSVREFTTEIVDEILLCHLIDAAVQAPSAVNEQLWSFCVLRDKALLVRISNAAKAHMLRTSQIALVSHHFQETAERSKIQYLLRRARACCDLTDGPWAVEDCALAAENLLLTARAAELGTHWIGFAQTWLETAGEGNARLAGELPARLVHHRQAPEEASGYTKAAGHSLDRPGVIL